MDDFVRTDRTGDTVIVTLNRPNKANAYHRPTLEAMARALDACEAEPSLRVVIIRGEGRHFCAGADFDELKTRDISDALCLRSAALFDRIAALPLPVIAAIHGAALGGGLELALACDLRVAAADAFFGLPETQLGLLPAAGGLARLPRVVGDARARELVFTGRRIDAETAARYGLVHDVTPAAVLDAALETARQIEAADGLAVRLAKRAMNAPVPDLAAVAQAQLYCRRASPRA